LGYLGKNTSKEGLQTQSGNGGGNYRACRFRTRDALRSHVSIQGRGSFGRGLMIAKNGGTVPSDYHFRRSGNKMPPVRIRRLSQKISGRVLISTFAREEIYRRERIMTAAAGRSSDVRHRNRPLFSPARMGGKKKRLEIPG